jgi:hypothetical protein
MVDEPLVADPGRVEAESDQGESIGASAQDAAAVLEGASGGGGEAA